MFGLDSCFGYDINKSYCILIIRNNFSSLTLALRSLLLILQYNTTTLQLMLFSRREGKWDEVLYADMLFTLR